MELSAVISLRDKLSATMNKASKSVSSMTDKVNASREAITKISATQGINLTAKSNISDLVKAANASITSLKGTIDEKELVLKPNLDDENFGTDKITAKLNELGGFLEKNEGKFDTYSDKLAVLKLRQEEFNDSTKASVKLGVEQSISSLQAKLTEIENAKKQFAEWQQIKLDYDDLELAKAELSTLEKSLEQLNSTNVAVQAYINFKNDALQQIYDIDKKLKSLGNAVIKPIVQLKDKATEGINKVKTNVKNFVSQKFASVISVVDKTKSVLSSIKTGIAKVAATVAYPVIKIKDAATEGLGKVKSKLTDLKNKVITPEVKLKAQQAFDTIKKLGSEFSSLGTKAGKALASATAKIAKGTAVAITSASVAVAGLGGAAIKAGIEYESAFAGVVKTVDATDEQLEVINEGIKDMAKTMPTAATEIAGVAEAAGQLGIKTENILGFTKTMTMLGDATNMSAEDASTSLARFANVTGMSQENFDRLGSTIVSLGNNFATTESEITDMAQNIASAGSQVGMSEAEIMGFAAALSSVGMEAAGGGTAISKLMVDMQLATEQGGDSLNEFAKVAGMSASEFKQAFQKDAAGAISSFVTGLSDTERLGGSAIKILDDMGITETRLRDTILRAASSGDLFTNAIETGSRAWEENTALTNEAAQRYATMESQIGILKNRLTDLGIEFYQSVNNPMSDIISTANGMVEQLSKAFKENGLSGLVSELGTILADIVTQVSNAAPQIINVGISLIDNLITGIEQNAPKIAEGAAKAIGAFINGVITLMPKIVLIAMNLILQFVQSIIQQLPEIMRTGQQSLMTFINGITSMLPEIINAGIQLVLFLVESIISMLPEIINSALTMIQTLVDGLIQNIPMIIQSGIVLIVSLIEGLISMLPSLVMMAIQLIMALVEGIFQNLPLLLNSGVQLITSLVQGITSMLPMIIQSAIQLIISLITGIIENLPAIVQAAVEIVMTLAKGIIQAFPQIYTAIPKLIMAIIDTILSTNWLEVGWEIIKGIGTGILDGAKGFGDSIINGVKCFLGFGEEFAVEEVAELEAGLNAGVPNVMNAANNLADGVNAGLQPDYGMISGYGMTASDSLATGVSRSSYAPVGAANNVAKDTALSFAPAVNTSEYGNMAGMNLASGIDSSSGAAISSAESLASGTTQSLAGITDTTALGSDLSYNLASGIDSNSGLAITAASSMSDQVKDATNADIEVNITANSEGLESFKVAIENLVTEASTSLQQLPQVATQAWGDFSSALSSGLSGVNTAISENLQGVIISATTTLQKLTTTARLVFAMFKAVFAMGMSSVNVVTSAGMFSINLTTTNGMNQMCQTFSNGMSRAVSIITSGMSSIRSIVASVNLYSSGQNIMNGLNQGMLSKQAQVMATARNIATSISNTINRSLDIHSPSKITTQSGEFTGEGLVVGMENKISEVKSTARDMSEAIIEPVRALEPVRTETPMKPELPDKPKNGGGGSDTYYSMSIAKPVTENDTTALNNYYTDASEGGKSSNVEKHYHIERIFDNVTVRSDEDIDKLARKVMEIFAEDFIETTDNMGEEEAD